MLFSFGFLNEGKIMRVVIQKVSEASVSVNQKTVADISKGLLVLVGIEDADTDEDIDWLCKKIVQLRIFNDDKGVMNRSVIDESGEIIVVSQFTLHAKTKKGNRPSYIHASKPDYAVPMYEKFCERLSDCLGRSVQRGVFGAHMNVALVNDGPVTIWIDTKNRM
jgi:D-tyrosyl-tRNA(Tyr) deacylase